MIRQLLIATAFSANPGGASDGYHIGPMVKVLTCGGLALFLFILSLIFLAIAFRMRRELQPWSASFKNVFYAIITALLFMIVVGYYNMEIAPSIGRY